MAENKKSTKTAKSTAKNRSTAKKSKINTYGSRDSNDFPVAYIGFRAALDSVEVILLRYCFKDADPLKRIDRMDEMENDLKNLILKYQDEPIGGGAGHCPDGLYPCNGFCVPYVCPFESEASSKEVLTNRV